MSNKCSAMAWERNFGSMTRKLIAARCADHADDDGRGIFPSVGRIAAECNVSERTVQRTLADFVDEGLLVIVSEGGKGAGDTRRYDFDMAKFEAIPRVTWKRSKGDRESPLSAGKGDTDDNKGDSDDTEGCHRVTQTIREPSGEPERERARADEGDGDGEASADDPRKFEKRVKRIADNDVWQTLLNSSVSWTVQQFAKLTVAERGEAEAKAPAYLAWCKRGKVKPVALGVYFRDRKWADLPEDATADEPDRQIVTVKAGGAAWAVSRMADLLLNGPGPLPPVRPMVAAMIDAGKLDAEIERLDRQRLHGWPKVNRMHEALRDGKPWAPQGDDLRFVDVKGLAEPVEVGSALFEDWKALHEKNGWPWPDLGLRKYLYFPAGGPEGLPAFKAAIEDLDKGDDARATGT